MKKYKISCGVLNVFFYLQMFANIRGQIPQKRGARLRANQLLLEHEISLMLFSEVEANGVTAYGRPSI